jgi:TP901 family phage tail tape measure protein
MAVIPVGAKVTGDTSGFVGAMGQAKKGLAAFTGAAGLATAGIAVLAGLMAGAAIGAARDYQVELVKLNTLVGISTEQVKKWAGAMKGLAGETGKAPADLAQAMFAISSGGARGTAAMELLEHSAKASAIGLGDMSAIGRTAGAMLQAFGDEGLTAERAIDVLTSTVREGNLEASSLAAAFSRVLGPAKAMGSSVEDVGAFMATFTRLGGSTEEASTSLLNVFNLLIKPPKQAREAMEGMGMSLEDIRATIEEDGLLAGLMMMKEGIGDNIDVLGEVIPNVRSLIGFLNTVGLQSESYAEIQENVNDSLGLTAEGFDTWAESAEAAHNRLNAEVKVLMTTWGEGMLPTLDAVLNKFADWIGLVNEANEVVDPLADRLAIAAGKVEDFAYAATVFKGDNFARQLDNAGVNAGRAGERIDVLRRQMARLEGQRFEVGSPEMKIAPGEGRGGLTVHQVAIRDLSEAIIEQQGLLAEWTGKLELLEEAQLAASKAIQAEKDALMEAGLMDDEAIAAKKEREEAVASLVLQLDEELIALRDGEAALIDHQLAELDVGIATRQGIQDQIAAIETERDRQQSVEDLADAEEKAAKKKLRDLETLRQAEERAEDQRIKAEQRLKDAEYAEELREITRIAVEMADTMGTAFEDIITGTESVADAFGNMVEAILRQVQRLLIQKFIVEPIVKAILGEWGPELHSGGIVGRGGNVPILAQTGEVVLSRKAVAGLGGPQAANSINRGGPSVNTLTSQATNSFGKFAGASVLASPSQVIVQQSITFSPQLIDGRDGARFVAQQAPTIAKIVSDAARESSAYAGSLR